MACLFLACVSIAPATVAKMTWGAYVGDNVSDIAAFKNAAERSPEIVAVFVHWGNNESFPSQYGATVRDQNKTLLVFWEPLKMGVDCTSDPRYSYDAIINGSWDNYINRFIAGAVKYGGPVILVPFEEFNLNEVPWSGVLNNNTPAKHIQAWQKLRKAFRAAHADNVKFGWAPNNVGLPHGQGNTLEEYYPGDADVDYVGADGFNRGNPWVSFNDTFDNVLTRLEQYPKPVIIFSLGCADGPQKAAWIKDLGQVNKFYPKVIGWVWFSVKKERDWRVNSNPESLAAFQEITA